jgi:hypothetical protein
VSVLVVPEMEPEGHEWPTLGPQLVDWIQGKLVFGPGDLRGKPAEVSPEKGALISRSYEVYPRMHERGGRRRFKRVCWSLRKGTAKTETAAWLAAAELHPTAPVRTARWDERGCPMHSRKRASDVCLCQPIGGGVRDPYIPLIAYTEEQSEELCYGALRTILEHSKVRRDFDIGLERIMRARGDGKAVAVSTAPGPRDGARTTFQCADETHRFVLPRLIKAWDTMLANQPKRKLSDAWAFETTTAFAPGENSVAERTMHYASMVAEGRVKDSSLFYFHRDAGEIDPETSKPYDLNDPPAVKRAVIEASGADASWSDVDSIVGQFSDPSVDRVFLERVWLNRVKRSSSRAFDPAKWAANAVSRTPTPGAFITLGFDGSISRDSTGIVATEVESGWQWVFAKWERPLDLPREQPWEVPSDEVNAEMADAFARFDVWRLYADKPHWETYVDAWSGEFGEERVINWPTNQHRKMAGSVRSFATAVNDGTLSHSGDPAYARHVGNAHRKTIGSDDDGEQLFVIVKEAPMSPLKIDLAVAGVLSWQARQDAIAAGAKPQDSVYNRRAAEGAKELIRCL